MPGIEFTCTATIHILGLGVTHLCESDDPGRVIDHIHREGGLAVLAHPAKRAYPLDPDWIARLDGCEIWNNQDGKWLPQVRAIRVFRTLAGHAPGLLAFAGLDLHRANSFSRVANLVQSAGFTQEDILASLKAGRFTIAGRLLRLPASGEIGPVKMAFIIVGRSLLNAIRWLRDLLLGP